MKVKYQTILCPLSINPNSIERLSKRGSNVHFNKALGSTHAAAWPVNCKFIPRI
jgi:hypothetical protein